MRDGVIRVAGVFLFFIEFDRVGLEWCEFRVGIRSCLFLEGDIRLIFSILVVWYLRSFVVKGIVRLGRSRFILFCRSYFVGLSGY